MKIDSKTSLVDNYRDDKVRAMKSKELVMGLVGITMLRKSLNPRKRAALLSYKAQNEFYG